MTERLKMEVEVVYSQYQNSLIFSQKDAECFSNPFFFQLLISQGGFKRLVARVEESELIEAEISSKEFISLQDTIRGVIDTAGKAATIKLAGFPVQFVHFPNGEIGVGIGKGKYLLEPDDTERLRTFCAKTM